jgi:hypothetical protein
VLLQGEHRNRAGGRQHADQRHRPARPQPPADQQYHQQQRGQRDRRGMHPAKAGEERGDLGGHRVPLDRRAGELAELADDHDDGNPGQVPDEHRFGQQVSQRSSPGRSTEQAQHTHDDRKTRRQAGVTQRVPTGQRRNRRRSHQRRGGLRANR